MPATILHDLSPSALIPAIEANFVAWWSYFRYAKTATLHEEPEVLWLRSHLPRLKPGACPQRQGGVRAAALGDLMGSMFELDQQLLACVETLPPSGVLFTATPRCPSASGRNRTERVRTSVPAA
jgi:hypothetical protein